MKININVELDTIKDAGEIQDLLSLIDQIRDAVASINHDGDDPDYETSWARNKR